MKTMVLNAERGHGSPVGSNRAFFERLTLGLGI